MLAVTLMASIACFAQGKYATSIPSGKQVGEDIDYKELKYKVLGNQSGCYLTEVIGFCDAVLANPDLMDTGGEHNEFIAKTVEIVHYVPGSSTSPAMSVQSVATDAFKTVDSELASKVNTLIIDYDDSEESLDKSEKVVLPTSGNTFEGLTSLKEVQSYTPATKVAKISATSFTANVYKTAPLVVPEEKMGKYTTLAGWKEFYLVKDESGKILGNMNTDTKLNATDYSKLYSEIKKAQKNGTTVPYASYMDLNGDGKVNTTDYSLLYNIVRRNLNN